MEELTVNATYSMALFEAATQLNDLTVISEELKEIVGLFAEYPEFLGLLKSAALSSDEKKEIAAKAFEGKISQSMLNFIYILIDKHRISQFSGIARYFEKLSDARNGITKGTIFSVVALSEKQLSKIEQETGRLLSKKVKLINEMDVSLIGGIRIFIDGKLIDASVRTRLDELMDQLVY